MHSEADSLYSHAINPVFNAKKVGFSFCLVPSKCNLFREVKVSFQTFVQCLLQ